MISIIWKMRLFLDWTGRPKITSSWVQGFFAKNISH